MACQVSPDATIWPRGGNFALGLPVAGGTGAASPQVPSSGQDSPPDPLQMPAPVSAAAAAALTAAAEEMRQEVLDGVMVDVRTKLEEAEAHLQSRASAAISRHLEKLEAFEAEGNSRTENFRAESITVRGQLAELRSLSDSLAEELSTERGQRGEAVRALRGELAAWREELAAELRAVRDAGSAGEVRELQEGAAATAAALAGLRSELQEQVRPEIADLQGEQAARGAAATELEAALAELRENHGRLAEELEALQASTAASAGRLEALAAESASRQAPESETSPRALCSELEARLLLVREELVAKLQDVESRIRLQLHEQSQRSGTVLDSSSKLIGGITEALEAERCDRAAGLAEARAALSVATVLLHSRLDMLSARAGPVPAAERPYEGLAARLLALEQAVEAAEPHASLAARVLTLEQAVEGSSPDPGGFFTSLFGGASHEAARSDFEALRAQCAVADARTSSLASAQAALADAAARLEHRLDCAEELVATFDGSLQELVATFEARIVLEERLAVAEVQLAELAAAAPGEGASEAALQQRLAALEAAEAALQKASTLTVDVKGLAASVEAVERKILKQQEMVVATVEVHLADFAREFETRHSAERSELGATSPTAKDLRPLCVDMLEEVRATLAMATAQMDAEQARIRQDAEAFAAELRMAVADAESRLAEQMEAVANTSRTDAMEGIRSSAMEDLRSVALEVNQETRGEFISRYNNLVVTVNRDIAKLEKAVEERGATPDEFALLRTQVQELAVVQSANLQELAATQSWNLQELGELTLGEIASLRSDLDCRWAQIDERCLQENRACQARCMNMGVNLTTVAAKLAESTGAIIELENLDWHHDHFA